MRGAERGAVVERDVAEMGSGAGGQGHGDAVGAVSEGGVVVDRGRREELLRLASPAGEATPSGRRGIAPHGPGADAGSDEARWLLEEAVEGEGPGDGEGGEELSREHGWGDGGDGVAGGADVAAHGDIDDGGRLVEIGGAALLAVADAVPVEAEIAWWASWRFAGGTGGRPELMNVVWKSVEGEIESDQSVCASGMDQACSEHDEEVRLTSPRHLIPLIGISPRARGSAVPLFRENR